MRCVGPNGREACGAGDVSRRYTLMIEARCIVRGGAVCRIGEIRTTMAKKAVNPW